MNQFLNAVGDVDFQVGPAVVRRAGGKEPVPFFLQLVHAHGFQGRQAGENGLVGVGDGNTTAFQLVKAYSSGAHTWTRTITKPASRTVLVALDGVAQASGWSVDTTTGLVIFTITPASGVAITAGFEFDVPVRFDTDRLDVTHDLERLGSVTSIPLIKVRR
ncbi:MAG: DUF2460 domain-containing protein [Rhodobacteraceae bacterium]|nr:DUF2460 domain-containing protein [Paracoccaceae bacterium]